MSKDRILARLAYWEEQGRPIHLPGVEDRPKHDDLYFD